MKIKTESVLNVMNVLAWLVFIGLLIKAGSILTSYIVSISNNQAAADLYKGMDLSAYRDYSFFQYTLIVGYKIISFLIQAYVAYLMTSLLSGINFKKPFNEQVVNLLTKISYSMILGWVVVLVHNTHLKLIEQSVGLIANYYTSQFLILSGFVYILAQMFKRGIEMQAENNLTV